MTESAAKQHRLQVGKAASVALPLAIRTCPSHLMEQRTMPNGESSH